MKENDFNLNIPRYIDTFEAEEAIDMHIVKQELINIENEMEYIKTCMNKYLSELGL